MSPKDRFILQLTIVAASLLLVDLSVGKLLSHYYHHITHGEQGRLNYAIDSVTSPLLIFGSSKAAHHYVSTILADNLHQETYNAGKDKQGLFYPVAVLSSILRRYSPATLILDITPVAFNSRESSLDALSVLLPYYHEHPELRPIVDKRSPWERWKTLSSLYCYNSLSLPILKHILSDKEDEHASLGYVPEFDSLEVPPVDPYNLQQLTAPADTALVAAFEQFIQLGQQHHCRVAVVVSPEYFALPDSSATIRLAAEICSRENVPFLDYTRSPDFSGKPDLFYDPDHLNNAGALRFTRQLCTDLIAKGFR